MSTHLSKLFLFFLLLCSTLSYAQSWAPTGAKWYTGIIESIASPAQGYVESEAIADTLILSQNSKAVRSTLYNSNGSIRSVDTSYFYSDSAKVYHYRNGHFYLLYDFNAFAGDSWTTTVPHSSPFVQMSGNSPDTTVTIMVDSTGYVLISGQLRKSLFVHSVQNDWYFLNPIIEGVGSNGGWFPFIYDWMDVDIPFLRCYSDSQISFNQSTMFACNTLFTGVEIISVAENLLVYPNPVTSGLTISKEAYFGKLTSISLYDLSGRELALASPVEHSDSYRADLENIPSGFYVLRVNFERYHATKKIFKL